MTTRRFGASVSWHLFLFLAGGLFAEPFNCTRQIPAYDCNQPATQIGFFAPPIVLEIEDYVTEAGMFRVLFKQPDGKEIRALCQPSDLGKTPPGTSSQSTNTPSSPVASIQPEPGQIPILTAAQQFQPDFWQLKPEDFLPTNSSSGFRWTSAAEQTEARSAHPLPFFGKSSIETLIRFKNGRLDEARFLLYGRGDVKKEIDESGFQELIKNLESTFDQWTGFKGVDAWIPGNVGNTKRKSWFKTPLRVDLESSISRNVTEKEIGGDARKVRFRAEFLRVILTPYDGKTDIAQLVKPNYQAPQPTSARSKDLKERIKREANGDVFLEGIPMVDQGQKGYCVCATVERVMRYCGLTVDQNEMAKAANTLSGTSPDAMLKAVKKLGGQFGLVAREIMGFEFGDFLKEIDVYNRTAKKNKQKEIILPSSGTIDLGAIYAAMDPQITREVRLKKTGDRTKFIQNIKFLVDKGSPALWSVQLGLVGENPALPQVSGGHMRLIFGYNDKSGEIIYSDSWGAGHEFKRLKYDDAFVMTKGLYSLQPGS
ncbi:MAG: C39 family peptidase [Verrucomicrobiae bacterium]|nr:C39 family peptidase [Verrucomicrobiae bacterium]